MKSSSPFFFSPLAPGTQDFEEDRYLSQVFLYVAIIFIIWLLLA